MVQGWLPGAPGFRDAPADLNMALGWSSLAAVGVSNKHPDLR